MAGALTYPPERVSDNVYKIGESGRNRTCNPMIKSHQLYQIELRIQNFANSIPRLLSRAIIHLSIEPGEYYLSLSPYFDLLPEWSRSDYFVGLLPERLRAPHLPRFRYSCRPEVLLFAIHEQRSPELPNLERRIRIKRIKSGFAIRRLVDWLPTHKIKATVSYR